ncbi:hypothetical protein M758_UG272700 [Ceratodon purpureus]|nr:hypothetical protein M758_UG272700 [Ceratodon purpureus]
MRQRGDLYVAGCGRGETSMSIPKDEACCSARQFVGGVDTRARDYDYVTEGIWKFDIRRLSGSAFEELVKSGITLTACTLRRSTCPISTFQLTLTR